MRIPTSTIVMAVVTCVPFGLAIRDSVSGTSAAERYDDDDDHDDHESDAELEARLARIGEASEAMLAEHASTLALLYGAEPASLGPGLGALVLGIPEGEIEGFGLASVHRVERMSGTKIDLELDGTLKRVSIGAAASATDEEAGEMCTFLEERLTAVWGRPVRDAFDRSYWLNEIKGQRARLETLSTCALVIDKYVSVRAWLDGSSKAAVVPLWAIGQPARRLLDALGETADDQGEQIAWTAPGVGPTIGDTSLIASIHKGTIVGIEAELDRGIENELIERLTELYGEPTEDGADGALRWASKPPLQLELVNGVRVHLSAGKQR